MRQNSSVRLVILSLAILLSTSLFAQNKTVSGTVRDKDGAGIAGASIAVKGTNIGTNTSPTGTFSINVAPTAKTLVISYVGFATQEVAIGSGPITVTLTQATSNDLNEVVVVGYGTVRKRDLTGSVSSIGAKQFNTGQINSPEQLLQGKAPGVQITNSSGQPGAVTIVRIRGNNSIRSGNNPLYVVDGIPLDGRSAKPGFSSSSVGESPASDPLTFINPNEIAQIDILKDASASAIYGSRGANGVVLITTKKGVSGPAKVDVNATAGIGDIMRKVDVLDAAGYRAALAKFGAPLSDSGSNVNALDQLIRKPAFTQNYSLALGGGGQNGKYRASFFMGDQQGILKKTGLKKFVGNFNGQYRFLEDKLSIDFSGSVANVKEEIAPIAQNSGSNGSLISLGLIWNPTLALKKADGTYNQSNPSGQINPVALSDSYNDHADVTTVLASFSVGYKFTSWLEYKLLYGVNYSSGSRKAEVQGWLLGTGNTAGKGEAGFFSNKLSSSTLTHTLNFNKDISNDFNLSALAGYEYWTTDYEGNGSAVFDFKYNLTEATRDNRHYYDNLNAGNRANLNSFASKDPTVQIQSVFARATANLKDKYLLTATIRGDGSNKFGSNNKYAYFPSVAAAWNIDKEDFMKDVTLFQSLKLRAGYGQTGNQEFGADASLRVVRQTGFNDPTTIHNANPDLVWETVSSYNFGLDFAILNNRVYGSVDYFNKTTNDPVVLKVAAQPQPEGGSSIFFNLDGAKVENKGVEISLGADIVKTEDFTWNLNGNLTFLQNKFVYPEAGKYPLILTGALHGQGTSGAYAQAIAHNQPLNVYFLPEFQGFDKDGIGIYSQAPDYAGNPNPTTLVGVNTELAYKKFSLSIGGHGAYGNKLYNNTLMSVLNISNIIGGRNISETLLNSGESVSNPISTSTRFMEKGNYFKIHNATIRYNVGDIGTVIKNMGIYVAANNLFVITKYKGFDPEVNVDKQLNGVPSLGIDYIGFPTQRTFLLGLNFSL